MSIGYEPDKAKEASILQDATKRFVHKKKLFNLEDSEAGFSPGDSAYRTDDNIWMACLLEEARGDLRRSEVSAASGVNPTALSHVESARFSKVGKPKTINKHLENLAKIHNVSPEFFKTPKPEVEMEYEIGEGVIPVSVRMEPGSSVLHIVSKGTGFTVNMRPTMER